MNILNKKISLISDFNDQRISSQKWNEILDRQNNNNIFLTWHWQAAWWQAFKRGNLLIFIIENDNELEAIIPLFADSGMIYFVGSGGSDYLDFIGIIEGSEVIEEIFKIVLSYVPDFVGFRFYHVPDDSKTCNLLNNASNNLNLDCFDEGELVAPSLNFTNSESAGINAANKKSLVRHEKYFRKEGGLTVKHFSNGELIKPQLNEFFRQHKLRWGNTPYPSLFNDQLKRDFYEIFTMKAADTNWLQFTRIDWHERPIAFHYGFHYRDKFLWYKPSFDIDLAKKSPGEVLIRQLILKALEDNAREFDFGIGDEAFKRRFANKINYVRTWGIYPKEKIDNYKRGNR